MSLRSTYLKNGNQQLVGFADSNWIEDVETQRSTSGYIFILVGAVISWMSQKQSTVTLLSTKAEYMLVCTTT